MLDLGLPFFNLNGEYESYFGEKLSALMLLASDCGYFFGQAIDVVEKAILLVERKADISCRDSFGNTVLHTVLKSKRYFETTSKKTAEKMFWQYHWTQSIRAPKELLMVFISAGADVYASNDLDETASMVASAYGREDEWIEALELCGYDARQVLESCIHRPPSERQTSKMSFDAYCQRRQQQQYPRRFEEIERDYDDSDSQYDDEDESNHGNEDTGTMTDDTGRIVDHWRDGKREISGGTERAENGVDVGLDTEDNKHAEDMVGIPALGVDNMTDNVMEGINFSIEDWLDNDINSMPSFWL